MSVSLHWMVILIICIIIVIDDYIEKLDNTFIYPQHQFPNQYNNKYYRDQYVAMVVTTNLNHNILFFILI